MDNQEDYLQLSGIQHFMFCPRQWGLIHIENQWAENYLTITGEQLHERVHSQNVEKRKDTVITRAMYIFSRSLEISGQCDVVEFHEDSNGININGMDGKWIPIPIEYKRGKGDSIEADKLQLCAEAMCLEEMLVCNINKGFIYYGQPKKRTEVIFNDDLKNSVVNNFKLMHEYFKRGFTPKPKKRISCNSCSIKDLCLPKIEKVKTVQEYINDSLKD
ncbi:MAG: CRISPR-associated protein Cas4 [Bdellovibrionota bacterium]|nr:CRISPR-associated protein Cas4 [Pseudomonadota bacterium]MDY6091443.1 CRISPR-associated protein Cas4 [Bdellovibrionota bacterium]